MIVIENQLYVGEGHTLKPCKFDASGRPIISLKNQFLFSQGMLQFIVLLQAVSIK